MFLLIDATDVERVADIIERRATEMIPNAIEEGTARANSYASAGGRRRAPESRRYFARPGVRRRVRRATGNQIGRMIERVLYRRLIDFWGSW
jgi:hypothetical protein